MVPQTCHQQDAVFAVLEWNAVMLDTDNVCFHEVLLEKKAIGEFTHHFYLSIAEDFLNFLGRGRLAARWGLLLTLGLRSTWLTAERGCKRRRRARRDPGRSHAPQGAHYGLAGGEGRQT